MHLVFKLVLLANALLGGSSVSRGLAESNAKDSLIKSEVQQLEVRQLRS
jgi:hypothetical protein